jgi:hypothetical protein
VLGNNFLWSSNWSDSIWKCTVNFPLMSLGIKVELSIKCSMLKWHKYNLFHDKSKYSIFDTSCQGFESISQIIVCHIHKNTVMGDEHIVSLQSNMAFPPGATRQPRIVLQRVEQVPAVREIMVSAMCLCADKRIISSYSEDLYDPKHKMFSRNLTLHFILCGLRF